MFAFSARKTLRYLIFKIFSAFAEFAERRRDHRAEDDDHPDQIQPDEHNRNNRQSAVNGCVNRVKRDNLRKNAAKEGKQNRGDQRAGQRVADFDFFVGNQDIKDNQRQNGEHARQDGREEEFGADKIVRHKFLERKDIAAHRKAGAQKQRPQRNDGPVEGNLGADAARFVDFEDKVQAVFDGGKQQNGGNDDADDADGGQLGGGVDKLVKVEDDFLLGVGNKVFEQHFLKLGADFRKNRKNRENGQSDGNQRHDCNQRSVAQRGGNAKDHVALGASGQEHGKVFEAESAGFEGFKQLME